MTDRVGLAVAVELSLGALGVVAVLLLAFAGVGGQDTAGILVRSGAIVSSLVGWAWMLRIALLDPEV